MASDEAHSRIIAQAANAALVPLGIRRKGRSRTWLDDQAWWLGVVEFQPSWWSKGSYLNVGVMWLWDEVPYHVFDVGYRVSGFEHYRGPTQFEASAQSFAKKAREQVLRYRRLFGNPSGAADYYAGLGGAEGLGSLLPAGIALGLVGRWRESRERFESYIAIDDDRDWAVEKKERASGLLSLVEDREAFLADIRQSIRTTRELLKLPPLADWPF